MKKLEELKQEKINIEDKIKKIERLKAQRGLFKKAKEAIGHCYKFRNSFVNSPKSWYIYAIVKNVKLEDAMVYMILDTYELTDNGEINIHLNNRNLESYSPMHCWNWIEKKTFEENRTKILKQADLVK